MDEEQDMNEEQDMDDEQDTSEGLASSLASIAENAKQVMGFLKGSGQKVVYNGIREVTENPDAAGAELAKAYRYIIDNNKSLGSCLLRAKQSFDRVVGNSGARDYDEKIRRMNRRSEEAKPHVDLFSHNLADTGRKVVNTRAGKFVYEKFRRTPSSRNEDFLLRCTLCDGLREETRCESRDDPNKEVIGPKEAAIAQGLRSLCTPYGEEKETSLLNTSNALTKLGRIYLHKAACETRGILQKLSFVRCFALLHAARIRFEIQASKRGSADTTEIDKLLIDANAKLLTAIGSANADPSSLKTTPQYSMRSLSVNREQVNEILSTSLAEFSQLHTTFKEELDQSSLQRIEKVKHLNDFMSEKYIELVQNIAMDCLRYLGAPPVRFTIVGLGSLARREITLFSDFEHAILLEEGSHSDEVMEYFRWFTVLFQVIMIGIGETIVPSLCVRSINNLYSDKKADDCWFHDIYTPCGVAFDGMAPFSCATPLGRQIVDKICPKKMEFIKTVGEMLVYMVPETNSAYERNLKHMLSTSCFVFGDENLYWNFREGAQKIIQSQNREELAKESIAVVTQNRIPQIRDAVCAVRGRARLNQKTSYYRPFTLLIACLGRIHDVNAFETFEILDELEQKGAINCLLHRKLTFAFAIICEIRIRSYSLTKTQRQVIFLDDVRRLVGEEAEWICKDMMQWLQDSVARYADAESQDLGQDYGSSSPKSEVRKWYFRGQYETAVEVGKQYLSSCEHWSKDESAIFLHWLFKSYFQAGQPIEKRFYWDELEPLYHKLTQSPFMLQREKAECYCIMSEVYEAKRQLHKAHEVTKMWLQFYLKGASKSDNPQLDMPKQYERYLLAAHTELRPDGEKMPEFLDNILSGGRTDCASTLRYLRYMIQAAAREGEDVGDASWLADLANDIRNSAREIDEPRKLLKVIWAFQINNRRWEDALRTVDYIEAFPNIPCTDADHRASEDKDWSVLLASCAVAELVHVVAKGHEAIRKQKNNNAANDAEEENGTARRNSGSSR